MLARRFTMVCLVVAIFGMGLSMLVAEKSRPDGMRTHSIGCDGAMLPRCSFQTSR
jgi:hypothetical protein